MNVTEEFYKKEKPSFIEMITSCLMTTAENPEFFSISPHQQYFIRRDGKIYFYDDDAEEYLFYSTEEEFMTHGINYVSLLELKILMCKDPDQSKYLTKHHLKSINPPTAIED